MMSRYTRLALILTVAVAVSAMGAGAARAQFTGMKIYNNVYSTSGTPTTAATTINTGAAAAECKIITNTGGKKLYIPLGSTTEWEAFYAKSATLGFTVGACNACTVSASLGSSLASGVSITAYLAGNGN
ncbi:MAG: hypothetical protein HY052_05220 [Proteobacteria bacterium]|nr:hypothetical protein [Pseudomonadota bacterium]